jgi:chorismate mutase
MTTRGIRGATTIETDSEEEILSNTSELLKEILVSNPGLIPEDIACAIFTTTADITAAFPARAARNIGWNRVPMICAQEIPVPDSLPMCIRVLINWNTNKKQAEIQHVYLQAAITLRPELTANVSRPRSKGEDQ